MKRHVALICSIALFDGHDKQASCISYIEYASCSDMQPDIGCVLSAGHENKHITLTCTTCLDSLVLWPERGHIGQTKRKTMKDLQLGEGTEAGKHPVTSGEKKGKSTADPG